MFTFNSHSFLIAFAAAGCCSSLASACDRVYQASLLTLPPSQGWSFAGSSNSNATASSGTLLYGPSSFSGWTYWQANLSGGGMDFSKVTWSLTVNVRLTNASFGNYSGYQRGGFVIHLGDKAGRWVIADIGSSMIDLRNDGLGGSSPQAAADFASTFRQVTLEAGPGGGRVLIDGTQVLTLPLGTGGSVNDANFGDVSILGSADLTEIKWAMLVPSVDSCPGDLNCDVMVDDSDFSIFALAYNLLLCEDPAMPLSCPADFNNDGFVDDADFSIFASAYDKLVCE